MCMRSLLIFMTRPIFIFISSLLVLAPIVIASGMVSPSIQLIFCMPFILLLGIPHGAIDNVLYINKKKLSQTKFISIYLLFVGLNVLLWVIKPDFAYVAFLLLSAYHFGQSQFSHYLKNSGLINKSLYLFWGIAILSALVFFNLEEIGLIMNDYKDFAAFYNVHDETVMRYIFGSSTIITLLLLAYLTIARTLRFETLMMELFLLAAVFVCFYFMPLLVGFTLYFVILHSLKVLREEFSFLAIERKGFSVREFIKLVAPFTMLSIFGIGFLFALIALEFLQLSYGYVFLIIVSSITLPHAFVMNRFYNILSFRGINRQVTT